MSTPNDALPPVPPQADGSMSPEERQWGMFAHLSALLGGIITAAMGGGWGCFIGPLVI